MTLYRRGATLAVALIAAFAVLACQPQGGGEGEMGGQADTAMAETATVDTAAIEATFDSMRTAFEEAVAAGDYETQAAMFSRDAVFSATMAPPVRGRDSIRAALERSQPAAESASIEPMDTWILGPDRAIEYGTSTITATPEGADEPRAMSSTYFILLERTSEGWKITREVVSTNQPPPGGGM